MLVKSFLWLWPARRWWEKPHKKKERENFEINQLIENIQVQANSLGENTYVM